MQTTPELQAVLKKTRLGDLTDKDRELVHQEHANQRRRILELDRDATALRLVAPMLEGPNKQLLDRAKPQIPTAEELRLMPVAAIPSVNSDALQARRVAGSWEFLLPWELGSGSQLTKTTPPWEDAKWSNTLPSKGEISLAVGAGCYRACPTDPPDYTDDCYSYANESRWFFGRGSEVSGSLKVLGEFPFGPLGRRTRLDVTATVEAWPQYKWPLLLSPTGLYDISAAWGSVTLAVAGHMPPGQEPRPSTFRFFEAAKRGDGVHRENATRQFVVGNSCVLETGGDYVFIQVEIDLFVGYWWPTTSPDGNPGIALLDMSSYEDEHALMWMWGHQGPVRVGTPHIRMSPA